MPTLSSVTVEKGRARKGELGAALVTPSADLSASVVLTSTSGAKSYLPAYRSAEQRAGGHETFGTTVTDDGTLTIFLEIIRPDGLSGDGSAATPIVDGYSFSMILDASGNSRRFALQSTRQGSNLQLSTKLAGDDLQHARAALFDINPNVAVQVTQPVKMAAQQTADFVQRYWSNDTIRDGLLAQFGGIPFDSAATYLQQAIAGDPDFTNQYLVLSCVYVVTVGVAPLPGYIQWQVNWNGRAYNYYQDNRERTRVFYVPDRLELATGPSGAPTVSLLQFSVPPGASSVSQTRATFRSFGNPIVDMARIQNASQVLANKIGGPAQMICIEDGHDVKKTFTQYLPNAEASSETGSPTVQPNASIDLVKGLRNELDLNFNQFRALWAAICSDAPEKTLFRGWVDLELAGGRYKDRIDFNGRLPAALRASFFDDILDTSSRNTYPTRFTVQTVAKVFQGTPAVLQIGLTFAGGTQVRLEPGQTRVPVSLERSIRDIIFGNQPPDLYPYRMRVVRDDGTMTCCDLTTDSSDPDLWVLPATIAKCLGPCS
jgi:hypothetical protein